MAVCVSVQGAFAAFAGQRRADVIPHPRTAHAERVRREVGTAAASRVEMAHVERPRALALHPVVIDYGAVLERHLDHCVGEGVATLQAEIALHNLDLAVRAGVDQDARVHGDGTAGRIRDEAQVNDAGH